MWRSIWIAGFQFYLPATAAFIKRYKEAYKTDTVKSYIPGDRIVRQWVILAARQYRLMPTTEGALDMKLDLSQMIDGFTGSEHALPIQPLYKDVTEFVARSHTFYTPTTLVASSESRTANRASGTSSFQGCVARPW